MQFSFRPLAEADIRLLRIWTNKPHVQAFWQEEHNWEVFLSKYQQIIADAQVSGHVIEFKERPIGYIEVSLTGDDATVSMNMFIGDSSLIGKGNGPKIIKSFIKNVLKKRDPKLLRRIQTTVDDTNLRAIKALKKAKFTPLLAQERERQKILEFQF